MIPDFKPDYQIEVGEYLYRALIKEKDKLWNVLRELRNQPRGKKRTSESSGINSLEVSSGAGGSIEE